MAAKIPLMGEMVAPVRWEAEEVWGLDREIWKKKRGLEKVLMFWQLSGQRGQLSTDQKGRRPYWLAAETPTWSIVWWSNAQTKSTHRLSSCSRFHSLVPVQRIQRSINLAIFTLAIYHAGRQVKVVMILLMLSILTSFPPRLLHWTFSLLFRSQLKVRVFLSLLAFFSDPNFL